MNRKLSLSLKIVGGIVGVVVLLLVSATMLLNTQMVQDKLLAIATERLQEKLQTQVKIDHVSVNVFTQEVNLKGLEVEDQQQRKMLELERLSVKVDLWQLLARTIVISKADMEGVNAILVKPQEGPANYQFVIDAFKSKQAKPAQTDSAAVKKKEPFDLNIHHLKLARIGGQFDYYSKKGPQTAKFNLGSLLIDEKDAKHQLTINGLHFVRDNHKPRKNKIRPKRGWFDVGHLDVIADMKMTIDYMDNDSVHAKMTECVARDTLTGFNVKDLHFSVGATKQHAHLRDIVLQHESTVLTFDTAYVVLPSKKQGRKFSFQTSVIHGKTQLKDISRPFAPVLKNFTMPLELSVVFSGNDSALVFRDIEVHTPDKRLTIDAVGGIDHLKKKEDLDIHFHVSKMKAKGKVKQEIIQQFAGKKMMMNQLDALGDITFTGDVHIPYRREEFRGLLGTAVGQMNFNFMINEETKYITGHVDTRRIQVGKVLKMPEIGDVGLKADFKVDIHKERTARLRRQYGGKMPFGDVKSTIYEASYKKIKVKNLLVDIKSMGGYVEGSISQQNKGLDWACDFSFTDIDKMSNIKIKPKMKVKVFDNWFKKKPKDDAKDKKSKDKKSKDKKSKEKK